MAVSNHKKIQHLYLRAGFGLNPSEWSTKRELPVNQAVDELFAGISNKGLFKQMDLSFMALGTAGRNEKRSAFYKETGQVLRQRNLTWINQMATGTSSPLVEKMTLFWHGHFANFMRFGHTAIQQINMLRENALGNFKDLLTGISRDPGMLHYLDANNNQKGKINENFGRELLELFTLGIGNYTQTDVVEASRAFTGWSHDEHFKFLKKDNFHDNGQKTFLGRTGNFDGDDILNIILQEKATARLIAKKIYAYFVNEKINQARVTSLADEFYASNYDVGKLMRRIFESPWFYDEENIGIKIKSPTELIAGTMKVFNMRLEEQEAFYYLQRALGQKLFEPPNVSGWPSGRLWINSANIMMRMGLASYLLQQMAFSPGLRSAHPVNIDKTLPVQKISGVSFAGLETVFGCCQPDELLRGMAEYLLQPKINHRLSFSPSFNPSEKLLHVALQLMRLPEYQVC